jgi:hypothetical protein
VVAGAVDGGGVNSCVGPTSSIHVDDGAPSLDPSSCISLFKKLL